MTAADVGNGCSTSSEAVRLGEWPEMTVGDLLTLLSVCDRDARVRLAMNPFFPMAHRLAQVAPSVDDTGRPVVYLAEGRDEDNQLGHLPPEVAMALAWHDPVQAPLHRPRRTGDR